MGIERLNEFWPEWRVESELGERAFGKVYKAVDDEAGFPVYSAIKVLSIPSSKAELDALESEGMTESESKSYFKGIVEDFVNEIKLMHTLKGASNIVSVEAFKIAEKRDMIGWDIFIRMELLTSFKDYLKSHHPTEDEVVKIGVDIANALEICQSRNIIHRDIKPANIFIDDFGKFKLGDFGIAKELEKTTGAVSAKGTFSYMAPEVARGMRYDNTVDIYSLGLVLYSLLNNNRPPFVNPYRSEVGYNDRKSANDRRLAGEALPAPCNASSQLSEIILTACSYDPSRRFKSATAFKKALLSYMKDGKEAIITTEITKTEETVKNIDETVTVRNLKDDSKIDDDHIEDDDYDESIYREHNKRLLKGKKLKPKKKKSLIKFPIIFAIIFTVLVILANTIIPLIEKSITKDSIETDDATEFVTRTTAEESLEESEISVGDIISFGHCEQDNDSLNGAEEIEWIVLEKKDGKALVISKYGLDCQPYNEEWVGITWENCTLRTWLNSEFYNTAFGEEEREKIETTTVVNDDNPRYGTEGGNDTYDKVFLLSIDEVETYFSSDEARECEPTTYADEQGVWTNSSTGNCWWWLRSPGDYTDSAADVFTSGGVYSNGIGVDDRCRAVRPALWINLES